jgi:transketolase C-terminal domain/subunit
MTENQDKLFADLDALSEQQIEVGLAAGVWSEEVRPLVQHYLYDMKLRRVEAAAEQLDDMREAVRVAVDEAGKSKARATAAFIIASGAMLAAMADAFVAFLALRKYGFQAPW